jgi:hypothetical protein
MSITQLVNKLIGLEMRADTAPDLKRLIRNERQNIQAAYAEYTRLQKCAIGANYNLGETEQMARQRRADELAGIMDRINGYRAEVQRIASGWNIAI